MSGYPYRHVQHMSSCHEHQTSVPPAAAFAQLQDFLLGAQVGSGHKRRNDSTRAAVESFSLGQYSKRSTELRKDQTWFAVSADEQGKCNHVHKFTLEIPGKSASGRMITWWASGVGCLGAPSPGLSFKISVEKTKYIDSTSQPRRKRRKSMLK